MVVGVLDPKCKDVFVTVVVVEVDDGAAAKVVAAAVVGAAVVAWAVVAAMVAGTVVAGVGS